MNNDLISRADAVEILRAQAEMATGTPKEVFFAAADMLEKLPTVDAMEVVRCRDCMWWIEIEDNIKGICVNFFKWEPENWYCASGEIKEAQNEQS